MKPEVAVSRRPRAPTLSAGGKGGGAGSSRDPTADVTGPPCLHIFRPGCCAESSAAGVTAAVTSAPAGPAPAAMTDTRGRSGGGAPTRGQNKQRRGRGGRAFGHRARSELVRYPRGPGRRERRRKRRIRAPGVADDPAAPRGVDRLTRELLHEPRSPGRGAHGSGRTNGDDELVRNPRGGGGCREREGTAGS